MQATNLWKAFPTAMRFFILLMGCTMLVVAQAADGPRPATTEEILLLKAALKNTEQDTEHWAYTETTVKKIGMSKRVAGETVVRFDPSKPYSDQYTVLKVDGRAPKEKELKKFRERGEKRGAGLARAADPAVAATPAKPPAPSSRKGKQVTADLDHPLVLSDDGAHLIYEIPLTSNMKEVPVEKIEVRLAVNKATRQVERGTMRIKESFRVKMVAKVKAGEGSIEFAVIDPQYKPVMVAAQGNLGASLLLLPVNATFASTRTDFQRVKPFNERLQVKLGPLELLDF